MEPTTPFTEEEKQEVAEQLQLIKAIDDIPLRFRQIANRANRGIIALSKIQKITNDEEDRIANDLLVKARSTIDGGKDSAGNPLQGIKAARMEMTKPLDQLKAILMEPETKLIAEGVRIKGLRDQYVNEKLAKEKAEQARIQREKDISNEIARVKAAMKENIATGSVQRINALNASIRNHVAGMTLENWDQKEKQIKVLPQLTASVYQSFFDSVSYDTKLIDATTRAAIKTEVQKELPFEKVNADYVAEAEGVLKMWIDDLPKKKEALVAIAEMEKTNAIAAASMKRLEIEREEKEQKELQQRLQQQQDEKAAEIKREQDEERLRNEFQAQVSAQASAPITGIRRDRVAVVNATPDKVLKVFQDVLAACFSNPKFKGHIDRDKSGAMKIDPKTGVPVYAKWAQPLLDFISKEFDGNIDGIEFKEVAGTIAKA
jgi:hypothetical protein